MGLIKGVLCGGRRDVAEDVIRRSTWLVEGMLWGADVIARIDKVSFGGRAEWRRRDLFYNLLYDLLYDLLHENGWHGNLAAKGWTHMYLHLEGASALGR